MFRPKMGIVKTRKLRVRPKIILFSETVQDYGNRSADICLAGSRVGSAFSLHVYIMISMTEIFRILFQLFTISSQSAAASQEFHQRNGKSLKPSFNSHHWVQNDSEAFHFSDEMRLAVRCFAWSWRQMALFFSQARLILNGWNCTFQVRYEPSHFNWEPKV